MFINNEMLYSQKDINDMCDNEFALERMKYIETAYLPPTKKWYGGNRDASATTARRKTAALGNRAPKGIHKNVNVVADALSRVRGSGYVARPKIRANPNNAPTPSWPAGPLIRLPNILRLTKEPQKIATWSSTSHANRELPPHFWGDPVHGQYTSMRIKTATFPPTTTPTLADSGFYNRFRYRNGGSLSTKPLYH